MLTNEQINEAAKKWCEQQGIDPNGMSNSPRSYAIGDQSIFKPIWEAVADEMRRIEKEDAMRRFLTHYQNSIAPIGDNCAIGFIEMGKHSYGPNLSGSHSVYIDNKKKSD